MSDCRFGVSPVNYPDPDPGRTVQLAFRGHRFGPKSIDLSFVDIWSSNNFYDHSPYRWDSCQFLTKVGSLVNPLGRVWIYSNAKIAHIFRFVAFWFENKVGWQPHCVEGIIHVWNMSWNHPCME